jgi:prevent-host-death family protein
MTKHWAVQEAKARFSELLRAAGKEPQSITLRGEETAVLLSAQEYRRITGNARKAKPKSFYEIWCSAPRVPEFELPPRKRERMRKVEF